MLPLAARALLGALLLAPLGQAGSADPGLVVRASEIIGSRLVDRDRRALGRIDDLVLDMRAERVVHALLDEGDIALPIQTLTRAPFGKAMMVPALPTEMPSPEEAEVRERRRETLRAVVLGSALLGKEVVDRTGDGVGEVRDFVVYLPTGEIREVLLEGEDGRSFSVPPERLLVPSSGEELVLNVSAWPRPRGAAPLESRR